MKFDNLSQGKISLYFSSFIQRPTRKTAMQILDHIENNIVYRINLCYKIAQKFTTDNIFLSIDSRVISKSNVIIAFGFDHFPICKQIIVKTEEPEIVKKNVQIYSINEKIQYYLSNKDELKELFLKAAEIKKKKKENSIKLANNTDLILKNIKLVQRYEDHLKSKAEILKIDELKCEEVEKKRISDEEILLLKKIITMHKWELLRLFVIF